MKNLSYKKDIDTRAKGIAKIYATTNLNIREIANIVGISKSTVHLDLNKRLDDIDSPYKSIVKEKIKTNKEERHMRGGEATKIKYKEIKEINKKALYN